MKNLFLFSFVIFLMMQLGCSDKDNKVQKNSGENHASNISKNKTIKKPVNKAARSEATFEEKIQNGQIIQLTKTGKPNSFDFGTSSKISGMKLPDGNIYQFRQDGDKMFLNVPQKGEMQMIKLSGKYYLFDEDNQPYEMKLINKELIAEATDLTDVLVALGKQ